MVAEDQIAFLHDFVGIIGHKTVGINHRLLVAVILDHIVGVEVQHRHQVEGHTGVSFAPGVSPVLRAVDIDKIEVIFYAISVTEEENLSGPLLEAPFTAATG